MSFSSLDNMESSFALNFGFWNPSDFRFRILASDLLVPSIAPPAPPYIDEEISKPARRSWKKGQLQMLRD